MHSNWSRPIVQCLIAAIEKFFTATTDNAKKHATNICQFQLFLTLQTRRRPAAAGEGLPIFTWFVTFARVSNSPGDVLPGIMTVHAQLFMGCRLREANLGEASAVNVTDRKTTYLLPCSCGREIPIEPRQAGETVSCECGRTSAAPRCERSRTFDRVCPLARRR